MPRHHHSDDDELPKASLNLANLREAMQLAGYLWPYRWRFGAALGLMLLSSLFNLAFPYYTGRLVDVAVPHSGAGFGSVDGAALALVLVLVAQGISGFFQSYWFNTVGEKSLADLRRDTYGRLIRLPMTFHTQRRVGELSSRLAADLTQIQDTLVFAFPHFLRQLVILVGGVILIAFTSGRLTLVMLSSVPVLIVVAVLFGRAIRKNSKAAQDRLADSNVIVEETLQGVATVKAYANERHEEDRYRTSLQAFLQAVLRGALWRGAFVSFIVTALFGAVVLVLWYGARLVRTGDLSTGQLTSFMLYTLFVSGAMGSFAELFGQIQRTLGATQRVRELLREAPEDVEPPQGTPPVRRLRGAVEFDGVTFRYPSRPEVEVLRGVTLRAEPGQRVALVGPSGAGKSTLVSLLLRFYEPEKGRLLLDGRDARELSLYEVRSQTAVVPQDVLLFGGTIAENIAYGRPGARHEEVVVAAQKANAHDFITAFPEAYETKVGERGVQLSGGQRQRVAIARAILRDPAILILDEATSALDSESESLVLQALDTLMEGRTSLVIAHRLSTVRKADRIYVLKDGATVESGTHDELITREQGVYRTLSELQFDLH